MDRLLLSFRAKLSHWTRRVYVSKAITAAYPYRNGPMDLWIYEHNGSILTTRFRWVYHDDPWTDLSSSHGSVLRTNLV